MSKKILIVGGVAGGASAAARARRLDENAQIIIFERGEHISFANCGLPYYISGAIKDLSKLLVQTPQSFRKRFNIDARTKSEVIAIDRKKKNVTVRSIDDGRQYIESYDKLVLSPGAAPIIPPVIPQNSQRVFTLRNISDMDTIHKAMEKLEVTHAVVVGGGYIGLEMAEAFSQRGCNVTLIQRSAQVFSAVDPDMAGALHRELEANSVNLRLGATVEKIHEDSDALEITLTTGEKIDSDIALFAVGVKPDTALAKQAGLEILQNGAIVVDDHMRTSDPDIYAVGDAIAVKNFVSGELCVIPLAGPANRQGRCAADNIAGHDSVYTATQGTAIVKIFGLTAASTGMNEKSLTAAKINFQKIHIHPHDHATYYPGASQMSLKVIFNPDTKRILGAQAIGTSGVDKRIDVISVSMKAGLNVTDLADLELSYAPPYGSAKDPVNYAGFVVSNVLNGNAKIWHAQKADEENENAIIVDVRTPAEFEMGTLPGAINIPVDELRNRLSELPKDKELLLFCQVGLRGYIACRMLTQHDFNCRNLSGGYKTWKDLNYKVGSAHVKRDVTSSAPLIQPHNPSIVVDACGLQCPGPVIKLKEAIDKAAIGQKVCITTTDRSFAADLKGWCNTTGHDLLDVTNKEGNICATILKTQKQSQSVQKIFNDKTIVVFSNDFDKAMAAFIIANGAAAMGSKVTLFFTFWGLNLLRKRGTAKVRKNFIEHMFGWMMPKGAEKTSLSKMNMAGAGLALIKGIMRKKNVLSLTQLIENAQNSGVRLVACSMSMDLMGIKSAELIEGVEEGGVAMYLNSTNSSNVNLFI